MAYSVSSRDADTDRQSGNSIVLTTPSLIGIVVSAVLLGSVFTLGLPWLFRHVLYGPTRRSCKKKGDAVSSTELSSSPQVQSRWQWRSGDSEEHSPQKPSAAMIAADKTSRSMHGIRPIHQTPGEEADQGIEFPEPLNSARSEKPSTIHTSASSDFHPLRRDTAQILKVQPSAFHRWSIESAEALRKSRTIVKVKRDSFRTSWTSYKSDDENLIEQARPGVVYDPERGLPDVAATLWNGPKPPMDLPLSSKAVAQDSQIDTPPGLRPGSYYQPWRSTSKSLLQVINDGSKDRLEASSSFDTMQDDHSPESTVLSASADASTSFGLIGKELPSSLRVSSYYSSLAGTPDIDIEGVRADDTVAVVGRRMLDGRQPISSLQGFYYPTSPGSSPGLHLEHVAGGDEAARTYRCWDETFRLSDYD